MPTMQARKVVESWRRVSLSSTGGNRRRPIQMKERLGEITHLPIGLGGSCDAEIR